VLQKIKTLPEAPQLAEEVGNPLKSSLQMTKKSKIQGVREE